MHSIPASVLVIENHPMMRSALCAAIAAEPDLKAVESNIAARESLSLAILDDVLFPSAKPDMILLALGNPGWDELRLLEALCKTLPHTFIIALTSNEVAGQEQAALEAGAHTVITKAVSRSELIDVLRELRTKALSIYSKNPLKREVSGSMA